MGQIIDNKIRLNYQKLQKYKKSSDLEICSECECRGFCTSFCKVHMSNIKSNEIPRSCVFNRILFQKILFKIMDIYNDNQLKERFNTSLLNLSKLKNGINS